MSMKHHFNHSGRLSSRQLALMNSFSDLTNQDLEAMSPVERRRTLHALSHTPLDPSSEKGVAQRGAISSLLRSHPYPAEMEAEDSRCVRIFCERWNDKTSYMSTRRPPLVQQFIEDCHLAMEVLGIPSDLVDMTVRLESFSKKKSMSQTDRNYTGIADVNPVFKNGRCHVFISLNKDPVFWELREPTMRDKRDCAEYAIHEIVHVKQMIGYQDKKASAFYADMNFQLKMLQPYYHYHEIYRPLLSERQAFLCQNGLSSLMAGQDIKRENEYLDLDMRAKQVSQEQMTKMAEEIIRIMKSPLPLDMAINAP